MQKIKDWLTKEVLSGVGRHLLTFGAGVLVAKGFASHEQITDIGSAINSDKLDGALAAIIAIIHSMSSNTPKAIVNAANAVPNTSIEQQVVLTTPVVPTQTVLTSPKQS